MVLFLLQQLCCLSLRKKKLTVCEQFPEIANNEGYEIFFKNQRNTSLLNSTQISQKCKSGYLKKGSTLTCNEKGEWIGEISCIPSKWKLYFKLLVTNKLSLNKIYFFIIFISFADCGQAKNVTGAIKIVEEFINVTSNLTIESVVRYSCEGDNVMVPLSSSIKCTNNSWIINDFECLPGKVKPIKLTFLFIILF